MQELENDLFGMTVAHEKAVKDHFELIICKRQDELGQDHAAVFKMQATLTRDP